MKVSYVGNQVKENWDGTKTVDTKSGRFAVVACTSKENAIAEVRVNKMIKLGYDSPNEFGDPDESFYWFTIEDREDYKQFMKDWKSTRQA